MADVLTAAQRRLNMSRIRGKDTRAELLLRSALFNRGFRFRLHKRDLPGSPDLVFAKHKVCLFFHGCFWHGHECTLFKLPKTRRRFWTDKIARNRIRDKAAIDALLSLGWRVLVVWECAIRGPNKKGPSKVIEQCADFIAGKHTSVSLQVAGK